MTTEQFDEAALSAQLKTIRPRLEIGLDKVGELAATMAAAYIGTYQEGWPQLAESTLKKARQRRGTRCRTRCCAPASCAIQSSTKSIRSCSRWWSDRTTQTALF